MPHADLRPPTSDLRFPLSALALLVFLGFALRLWQTRESLWIDELHTAWCALGSLGEVAPRAAMGNQSPLFFWFEWLLVRAFGASELTLRLPSVIVGSLLPVAVYWLVNRWTKSAWLGVFAAALVVVDHLAIFYATESRPYALIQFLALFHIALVAELAARPTLRLRIGFVLGAALLFYLHYTTALLIAAEVVFLAFSLSRWERGAAEGRRVRAYRFSLLALDLLVLTLLLLPSLPNLLAIYARRDNWAAFVQQKSVWTIFSLLPWSASVLVVVAGVVLTRWLPKRGRESFAVGDIPQGELIDRKKLPTPFTLPLPPAPTLLAACWLLVPLALAWATTATDIARLFFPRYLVASAPAAFVLTAFCLKLIPWRSVQIPLAAALLVYATYSSQIIQQFRYDGQIIGDRQEDWRGAVAWLNEQLPKHRYPVLLRSGLIEAHALGESTDSGLKDYCLYPLTSLYAVQVDRSDLSALQRNIETGRDVYAVGKPHGGVWGVDRSPGLAILIDEQQYRSPRVPELWTIPLRKSFGSIHVLLVRPPSKVPSTEYSVPSTPPTMPSTPDP